MNTKALTKEDVTRDLTVIFHQVFDNPGLTLYDEMTALDVPEWDSLNQVNLVVAIEQKYGIKFNTSQVAGLMNVGAFIRATLEKANARA